MLTYMKGSKFARVGGKISFCAFAATLFLVIQSRAQIQNLVNNNSDAQVNPNSQQGMFNWFVDGQNQLFQQWFWYRVGTNGPEHSIDTISAPSIVRPDAKTAYFTYGGAANGYSVEVDYVLTGQAPGSGQASVAESIKIHNFAANPTNILDFHFFQYSDFDLGNTIIDDSVQLGKDAFGKFNEALQREGGFALTSETDVTPGADHGEVNTFANTLNKLNDGAATTLN